MAPLTGAAAAADGPHAADDRPAEPTGGVADPYDDARVAALEHLWGEGQAAPGDGELTMDLARPVGLTSEMTVLDANAAMGAAGRLLAQRFGCWVTCASTSPLLAARGQYYAQKAGLGRKASVSYRLPGATLPKKTSYDCLIMRDLLCAAPTPMDFLPRLLQVIRPSGHLVLIDLVSGDHPLDDDDRHRLSRLEGYAIQPVSVPWLEEIYAAAGLDVWVSEDMTDRLRQVAEQGMRRFLHNPPAEGVSPVVMAAIDREIARWETRFRLFDGGRIRVHRTYATRAGTRAGAGALTWDSENPADQPRGR
ncbi:MAG: hypothetical protein RIE31_05170 [Alphaproteobacteria bacterium]